MNIHKTLPSRHLQLLSAMLGLAGATGPAIAAVQSQFPLPGFTVSTVINGTETPDPGPDSPACFPQAQATGYCVEVDTDGTGKPLVRLFTRQGLETSFCALQPDGTAYKAPARLPLEKTLITAEGMKRIIAVFRKNGDPKAWTSAQEEEFQDAVDRVLVREDFCHGRFNRPSALNRSAVQATN